ncbi:uncharacterized protein LOC129603345 isoform X2 [Betta splendens]|uniref:Uncharacterized protein LOC129603345 isoform X2 n=1 Tax=Betta splendens TaxID=158456 RepID=A0A9W2XED4_BETSP|nr:uncharacterized protein LOC129603345 isoform X2 [Betta splendens]
MDVSQMIIAFLVLKMNLQPISMKVLPNPNGCPSCPEGYFLKENCTITPDMKVGIRCAMCTNCSALDQETLTACSKTVDSVCGPKTKSLPPNMTLTGAENNATDFAPDQWIVPCIIVASLVLIILLSLFLILLPCWVPHQNKSEGLDLA